MKVINLKVGENKLYEPECAIFKAGKIVAAEVFASQDTTITITRGVNRETLTGTVQVGTVTVANGYGVTIPTDKFVSYFDVVTVTSTATLSGSYVIRLFVAE